jgi:hydrogenase/urease accessory protein HupE
MRRHCHKRGRLLLTAFIALLLRPATAEAHLVTTGLGPVYDGIGHFCTSLEDVMPAIALALLAGLRGSDSGRKTLFALPVAWLLGGFVGLVLMPTPELSRPVLSSIVAATFMIPGVLIAADLKLPPGVIGILAAALGLVHGYLDALGMMSEGATRGTAALEFVGVGAVLFVLVALIAALVLSLREAWMRIVFRVAGSWISAAGLLLLGWALKGRG